MNYVLFIFTLVSVFGFLRALLILFGVYKEPILWQFQQYGPREVLYLPGLPLLIWGGAFVFLMGFWAAAQTSLSFSLSFLGVLTLFAGLLSYNYYEHVESLHFKLLPYPRWYHELRDRTSRYERRRIAYMWLHLPARLRLTLNSSDRLFALWADFVIMGTIREEEETAASTAESAFYWRYWA